MVKIVISDSEHDTPVIRCDNYFIIAKIPGHSRSGMIDFEFLNNCTKVEAMEMVAAVIPLFDDVLDAPLKEKK